MAGLSAVSGQVSWLKRVWLPLVSFVMLAAIGSRQEELFREAGLTAVAQAQFAASYVVQIGVWLSAAYLLNRIIEVALWDGLVQRKLGVPVPRLIRDLVAAAIFTLAITSIVSVVFHKPVGGIWTAMGAFSVVVGLALRSVILDLFVGLAINLERPFKLGDFVLLHQGNLMGRVVEIHWRTTRIETDEGNTLIVPNNRIGDMTLTNLSAPTPKMEFSLTFSLDYAVPTDRALRVLSAGALAVAGTGGVQVDPEPKARIKGVSALGVDYSVTYWMDCSKGSPGKAKHLVLKSTLDQLNHAGLSLAYNKQDVFHAPMPQRQLDTADETDRVRLLSRVELFANLPQDELTFLAREMHQRTFRQGATLVKQNDPGESMFVLMEGLTHVSITFPGETAPTRVGQIQAGGFFGEMSLLTGEPRTASVTAATEVVVYEITHTPMEELFSRREPLVAAISNIVAERRLRNDEAFRNASVHEQAEQKGNLAQQIMHKIRLFFREPSLALAAAPA